MAVAGELIIFNWTAKSFCLKENYMPDDDMQ